MVLQCVRNSMLEDLHAGTSPSSASGDYSDVTVSSPYGAIPWLKVSRLNDYLGAAKAFDTALHDFQGEKRPYNGAVLPAPSNQLFVYVMPAQTKAGIYPLGGDARYLITADGSTIVGKRQLHKTIMENNPCSIPKGATPAPSAKAKCNSPALLAMRGSPKSLHRCRNSAP
jgi:hypothetical protein